MSYRVKFACAVAENKIGLSSRRDRFVIEYTAVDFKDAMRVVRDAAKDKSAVCGRSFVMSDDGFKKDSEIEDDYFCVDAFGRKEWHIVKGWTDSKIVSEFAKIMQLEVG